MSAIPRVRPAGGPFEAVIFDLDGVLVDTEPWWDEVRVDFARRHGRPWGPADQRAVMGGNSAEWSATMRERLGLAHLAADAIRDAVVAGMLNRYSTTTASPAIPGAVAALRRIAATHPVAIASSSHRTLIEAAVDHLGLHGALRAIVSSDEVAAGKPAPEVYLRAASLLGAEPGRCLVVEDSVNGVRAGRAAGMTVVLVPNASVPPAPGAAELAHLVVERVDALDPGPPAPVGAA